VGEIEIIVTGKRKQPPSVTRDPDTVLARSVDKGATAVGRLQCGKLVEGEFVQRGHGFYRVPLRGPSPRYNGFPRLRPISRKHLMNAPSPSFDAVPRSDWTREELRALFALPFPELLFRAQSVHRMHFDPREVQISTLL